MLSAAQKIVLQNQFWYTAKKNYLVALHLEPYKHRGMWSWLQKSKMIPLWQGFAILCEFIQRLQYSLHSHTKVV